MLLPYAAGSDRCLGPRPSLIRFKGSLGRSCPDLMSAAADRP
jgi:hypothetical protein